MTITGIVSESGKLQTSQALELAQWFKDNHGQVVEVSVRVKGKRSNKQQNYYRGVVVIDIMKAANALGNELTEDEVHEMLKKKFKFKSTTDFNSSEFEDKLNEIRRWAAEFFGITIKLPNELTTPSLIIATHDPELNTTIAQAG
jgi:hypothetical protein